MVSWPAEKTLARDPSHVSDLGCRAVGIRRGSKAGQHVVARFAPAVLDIVGEESVEEFQRAVGQRFLAGAADAATRVLADAVDELLAILHRYAEQIGDHQQRERTGEALDERATSGSQEVVEHLVGELPHGVLVLLEALRRDQPHQQRAVVGVGRRVEGGQLVAERQLVAVLRDQISDVVITLTFERHRKAGEGPGHRVARRPRLGVVEDRAGFLPAGHHGDVVVVLLGYRALLPQRLVIGVRVGDELAATEKVHFGEVVHHLAPFQSRPVRMSLSEMSIRFPYRMPRRQRAVNQR